MNPLVALVPIALFLALGLGGKRRKKAPPEVFEPPPEPVEPEPPPTPVPAPPTPAPPPQFFCPEIAPGGDFAVCEIQKEINGHLERLGYERITEHGLVDGATCGANEFLATFGDMPLIFDCAALGIAAVMPTLKERPAERAAAEQTFSTMLGAFQAACEPDIGPGAVAAAQNLARSVFATQMNLRQYDTALMAAEGELRSACPSWGGIL